MNQKSQLVRIYAKEPAKKQIFIGSVSNIDFPLIKNRIVGYSVNGTRSIVIDLLQKGGWDVKRDDRNIFSPVIETFMQIPNLNLNQLSLFNKTKENNCYFSKYLKSHKQFSLYDMFEKELHGMYPLEQLKRLIDELWSITTCVNQVGVGPGEICFTVLTNAKKGNKGDLIVTDVGDVEVKSTHGRLGSGAEALKFYDKAYQILKIKPSSSYTWNNLLQQVFYHPKLSTQEKINHLIYVSTQKLCTQKQRQLESGLIRIFKENNIAENLIKKDRTTLTNLVLTIQLACYQNDHQFAHLLSVNKATKNAYAFYFPFNNLKENVLSVYKQILTVGKFNSDLSIDSNGMRKGVKINLK